MSILVRRDTTIIVQGITGREAASFARDSLDYGARVVGGVTPGKGGQEVFGLPVTDTVAELTGRFAVDTSVISVPPSAVKDAAFEAVENGIRLLVIVTERVPRRDVVEILERCRLRGARLIGPNSLGVISPGESRAGMVGGPAADVRRSYVPGPVGVMSRSGGMTTEIANLLTLHGLGQSTCVSVGGDPIVGSGFADLLPLFEADPQTEAVVLFTEPGGGLESVLADRLREQPTPLPLFAFVAGAFVGEMPGVRFGHAATLVEREADTAEAKARVLAEAGVTVVDRLSDLPPAVAAAIGGRGPSAVRAEGAAPPGPREEQPRAGDSPREPGRTAGRVAGRATGGRELAAAGVFVEVALYPEACSGPDCTALIDVCPVDIFVRGSGGVVLDEERVDECTLCGLCLDREPEAVSVRRCYVATGDDEQRWYRPSAGTRDHG